MHIRGFTVLLCFVCVVALLYYSALCVSLLCCITNDYSPLLAHHCWLKTTDAQDDPNMELSLLDSFASDVDVKASEEPPGIPAGGNRSASGFALLDTFASDEGSYVPVSWVCARRGGPWWHATK